jgi:hypothetical protein
MFWALTFKRKKTSECDITQSGQKFNLEAGGRRRPVDSRKSKKLDSGYARNPYQFELSSGLN